MPGAALPLYRDKRCAGNLRRIQDNHPKLLLTLDEYMPNANYDGIKKMNVLDWLTRK